MAHSSWKSNAAFCCSGVSKGCRQRAQRATAAVLDAAVCGNARLGGSGDHTEASPWVARNTAPRSDVCFAGRNVPGGAPPPFTGASLRGGWTMLNVCACDYSMQRARGVARAGRSHGVRGHADGEHGRRSHPISPRASPSARHVVVHDNSTARIRSRTANWSSARPPRR